MQFCLSARRCAVVRCFWPWVKNLPGGKIIAQTASQTRMTVQRSVILDELRKLNTHPTADELYHIVRKRLPRISLGTVYRNLEHLAQSETIRKLNIGENIKRFDGCCHKHHHATCLACGRIYDIPVAPLPEEPRPEVPGFIVTGANIFFEGYCTGCRS